MEKYLYFRKNADVDDDDGIDDSIFVPVSRITGVIPVANNRIQIFFRSVNNEAGNRADDENVISDFVRLQINPSTMKEVVQSIARAINGQRISDGIITVADMSTIPHGGGTKSAVTVDPNIVAIHSINIAAAIP